MRFNIDWKLSASSWFTMRLHSIQSRPCCELRSNRSKLRDTMTPFLTLNPCEMKINLTSAVWDNTVDNYRRHYRRLCPFIGVSPARTIEKISQATAIWFDLNSPHIENNGRHEIRWAPRPGNELICNPAFDLFFACQASAHLARNWPHGMPDKISRHFVMQISGRIISPNRRNLKVGTARKITFLLRRVLSGSYVGAREQFSPDTLLAFPLSPSPRENDVLLLIYLRCCSLFVSSWNV